MRRPLAALLAVAAVGSLVACSDDSSSVGSGGTGPEISGDSAGDSSDTWVKPEVDPPAEQPTELVITDLSEGAGPVAVEGDEVLVHYVGVLATDGTEFDNSYDRGEPFSVTIGAGGVIEGWDLGLVGVQQGGRRRLDIPADLAYGDSGAGDAIPPDTAITFVIDVVAVLPVFTANDAPDIDVEGADNLDDISFTDLVVGDGVGFADGDTAVVHMVLYRADTGERLTATWGGPPLRFLIGSNTEVFPGIHDAVQGMLVGGRRQAQIPFGQVFNGTGNTNVGLPADIDLVAVIDLIAVY